MEQAISNNEDLKFDFETTADVIGLSSSTSAATIDFGVFDLKTTGNIYNLADNSKHYFGAGLRLVPDI